MTTRAEEGGTAGGSEKVERTGVFPTWVVVTEINLEDGARTLNPEIQHAWDPWPEPRFSWNPTQRSLA
jgi:hypothetical protein